MLLLMTSYVNAADVCKDPDLGKFLKLDYQAFDQSPPVGGWRELENKGKEKQILALLDNYRKCKKGLKPDENATIWFHSGQAAAELGQYDDAIKRMQKSYDKTLEAEWHWTDFVDGSIAFLKHDLDGLKKARAHLAQIESDHPYVHELDKLIDCFDSKYKDVPQCAQKKHAK